jgi:Domain of unknown function (DUF5122) beta-propeller
MKASRLIALALIAAIVPACGSGGGGGGADELPLPTEPDGGPGSGGGNIGAGVGTTGYVAAMIVAPDGTLCVGGGFTSFNGVPSRRIARLNASGHC